MTTVARLRDVQRLAFKAQRRLWLLARKLLSDKSNEPTVTLGSDQLPLPLPGTHRDSVQNALMQPL